MAAFFKNSHKMSVFEKGTWHMIHTASLKVYGSPFVMLLQQAIMCHAKGELCLGEDIGPKTPPWSVFGPMNSQTQPCVVERVDLTTEREKATRGDDPLHRPAVSINYCRRIWVMYTSARNNKQGRTQLRGMKSA